jgi:tetratricopeptide (TPR) repeat protein
MGGLVLWAVIAMLIGAAITQGPAEVSRWHLASALKQREDGNKEAAYEELASAIKGFPGRTELLLLRAEWEVDDGDKEKGLADIDKCLEKSGHELLWLQVHSLFLQNCGEFERAVEDWKKIEKFSKRSGSPPRASALNGLAYAQALANIELDDALAKINEALDLAVNEAALLDTRGFVLYRRGEYEEALKDMDRAVRGMDEFTVAVRQKYGEEAVLKPVSKIMVDARPRTLRELEPERSARSRYESAVRSAAVGHYHRGLVLAALGRKEEADNDLAVARELSGKEPDETLF